MIVFAGTRAPQRTITRRINPYDADESIETWTAIIAKILIPLATFKNAPAAGCAERRDGQHDPSPRTTHAGSSSAGVPY